jgi:hypothetical protein
MLLDAMKSLVRPITLSASILTLAAGGARADFIMESQFQGGGPGVTVDYTGPGNTVHTESTSAGAFTVTPKIPGGSPFDAYCVSLDVQVPTHAVTINVGSILQLYTVDNSFFTHSNYEDVGNRLAYILTHDLGATPTDDAKYAASLAIWHTIDKNFSYTGGSTAVNNLYTSFIAFTGYDEHTHYGIDTAKLFVVDPQGSYQNLIGVTSYGTVPEPASVVSAIVGFGGLGLVALRRRKPVA